MSDRGFQGSTGNCLSKCHRALLQNIADFNKASASMEILKEAVVAEREAEEKAAATTAVANSAAQAISVAKVLAIVRAAIAQTAKIVAAVAVAINNSNSLPPSTSSPTTSLSTTEQTEPAKYAKQQNSKSRSVA